MTTPVVPEKDNRLLYAAGDVVVWVGPPNAGAPTAFEEVPAIASGAYVCCGWVDTSGYIFKLDETTKEIPAAGILTPIRTILTGGSKSVQCNFLEALNPAVRSLYDDVSIFPIVDSPLAPDTGNIASYVIPDPPEDNRYAVIFDSIDGDKQMRLYAPFAKITDRGPDQVQQADVEMLDMTFTFYPGLINGQPGVAKRYIDYGIDMSDYFPGTGTMAAGVSAEEQDGDDEKRESGRRPQARVASEGSVPA